ncbi:MAG: hypothetical protein IJY10_03230, partial [Lachnospiraceae bacterium]|nr:hypothetical protein [Lachnospiraceae bacterium]
ALGENQTDCVSERWLVGSAAEQGVKVFGLSEALIEDEVYDSHTVILGYGGLSKAQILDGIERLKKAWL